MLKQDLSPKKRKNLQTRSKSVLNSYHILLEMQAVSSRKLYAKVIHDKYHPTSEALKHMAFNDEFIRLYLNR